MNPGYASYVSYANLGNLLHARAHRKVIKNDVTCVTDVTLLKTKGLFKRAMLRRGQPRLFEGRE